MKATDLLKKDHDVVDELFKRVEDTPPSKHPAIFKRIKNELDTHAHIEEKVFYPALKAKGDKALVDITAEGLEEHAQIKKFLREIARTTSKDTREAKLKVLIEDTRHHVKEEEDEMFPMVEDQFSTEEQEKLGEKLEAEKKKFMKAKRIPARREPPKGTVATVIEKAREFVAAAFAGSSTNGKSTKPAGNGRGKTAKKPSTKPAKAAGKSRAAKTNSTSKKASAKTPSKAKKPAAKTGSKARSTTPKASAK